MGDDEATAAFAGERGLKLFPGVDPLGVCFAEFERANLAFVFRDTKPDGDLDDTHEFVTRGAVPELIRSRRTTIVEPAI